MSAWRRALFCSWERRRGGAGAVRHGVVAAVVLAVVVVVLGDIGDEGGGSLTIAFVTIIK